MVLSQELTPFSQTAPRNCTLLFSFIVILTRVSSLTQLVYEIKEWLIVVIEAIMHIGMGRCLNLFAFNCFKFDDKVT